jgi:Spx/MgsR family transcriptional regulator
METTLYGIRNCDTMKKAKAWLDGQGVDYRFHDTKAESVGRDRLADWCAALGWEIVLNRGGTTFRKLAEGDKQDLDEGKAIVLMLSNPSMIKRPILDRNGVLTAGFQPDAYAALFGQ